MSDEKPKKTGKQIMEEVDRMMKEAEEHCRAKELIEKQELREEEMKQAKEDFINEMKTPTKQITVKIYPNTHKKLKVLAATQDTTLEKIATAVIEDKVADLDIVEYVKESFENGDEGFNWLQQIDVDNGAYDINDKLLKKGNPRKRINVKVNLESHKKLRVISAIQDRSLDNLVGSVIEYEIGEENIINTAELMDEILESIEDKE